MKLIEQNMTKKVDSLGRVTIPVGLRKRMKIEDSDVMEVFTLEADDGREMIVFALEREKRREDEEEQKEVIENNNSEIME